MKTIAEFAIAGPGTAEVFNTERMSAAAVRRAHYDRLMMDVVVRQSELEEIENRQKRSSRLIAAVSAMTLGLTSYLLFG